MALAILACSPERKAKDAAASAIHSVAVVPLADGPVIAIIKGVQVRTGGKIGNHRAYTRLDTHDLARGTRKASHLYPNPAGTPRCHAAFAGQLWCLEGVPPALVRRDARTLAITKDSAALAIEIPALADGVERVVPRRGGELVVWTGRGDKWLLGAGAARRGSTEQGKSSRTRTSSLRVPTGELVLGGPDANELLRRGDPKGAKPTGLAGLRRAGFLVDLETGEPVRWDDRSLAILTHEVAGDRMRVVGLGFDATSRWSTELAATIVEATIKTATGFVIVLRHGGVGPCELVAIELDRGTIVWRHEL